jgi:hypothetical protein
MTGGASGDRSVHVHAGRGGTMTDLQLHLYDDCLIFDKLRQHQGSQDTTPAQRGRPRAQAIPD